jgi:putative flippase GtrA
MHPRAQPLRYAIVGALTAMTYFVLTLCFTSAFNFPIQIAMVVAYPLSLVVHFTGQRWFVFRSPEGYALAVRHQTQRYVLVGAVQLGASLLITTFVPAMIGVDERIVYVVATFALTVIAYLTLRFHVFHGPRRAIGIHRSG